MTNKKFYEKYNYDGYTKIYITNKKHSSNNYKKCKNVKMEKMEKMEKMV
jgi:hypothetical protein